MEPLNSQLVRSTAALTAEPRPAAAHAPTTGRPRRVRLALAGVAAVAGALAIYVTSHLDTVVKAAIEALGSRATGTQVIVDAATVSLAHGNAKISRLRISNPEGYKTRDALEIGGMEVAFDTWSLASNPLIIHEVVIHDLVTTYELAPRGSNIGVIRANVASFTDGLAAALRTGQSRRRFVIEDLYVHGGRIAVSASLFAGRSAGRALPDLHLHDVGKDKGGITSAEIAAVVLRQVTGSVIDSVADLGGEAVSDTMHAAKDAGSSVVDKAKSLFRKPRAPQ